MASPLPLLVSPPSSSPLCGSLNSTKTSTVNFVVLIPTKLPVLFGKHRKCHVRLPNPELADFHFAITSRLVYNPKLLKNSFQTIIQVNDTPNTTFVNDNHIKHNTQYKLSDGDTIRICKKGEKSKVILECKFTSFDPSTLRSDFEMIEVIGKGSFGEVVKCKERATGNVVAVKGLTHGNENLLEAGAKNYVKREIQMAEKLSAHENIIGLRRVFLEDKSTYIVMELAPAGSLEGLLVRKRLLSEQHSQWITLDVAKALAFIHANNIIHRDIKPANILLMSTDPPVAKVGDLGLARKLSGNMTIAGTPYYMAPEALSHQYDCKVDCFSLGAVVFKMLTGITPFSRKDLTVDFRRRFFRDDRKTPRFEEAPEGTLNQNSADFIRRILILNPDERERMSRILRHRWLRCLPPRQINTGDNDTADAMDLDESS
ncbi:kinase-like protein [Panus rudis PR-1116 ss-1]|nr:kinase-like protein [Panus rudis PR-1116 ss-1]